MPATKTKPAPKPEPAAEEKQRPLGYKEALQARRPKNAIQIRQELAALEEAAAEAKTAYRLAADRARHPYDAMIDIFDELATYKRDLLHRRREADQEYEALLTTEVLHEILKRRLTLEPLDPHNPAMGFRVRDPKVFDDVDRLRDEAQAAAMKRDEFKQKHDALLAKDAARTAMKNLREAMDGDDPAVLAEALAAVPVTPPGTAANVLTTDTMHEGATR